MGARDGRAVGSVFTSSGDQQRTLIAQWDGSSWRVIEGPTPQASWTALLSAVAVDSAGGYWAVGQYAKASGSPQQALIARCS